MKALSARLGMALIAIALTALCLVAPAAAAPLMPELEVQLWPGGEPGGLALLTGVALDPKVSLPVTVSVPVPDGFDIVWVGENLGGDVAADPSRDYIEKTGPDGRWVEFSLRTARAGQVESVMKPLAVEGGNTVANLEWRQSVPASITGFSVRLPAGAVKPAITPAPVGAPSVNQAGDSLYTLASRQLDVGERAKVSAVYGSGVTSSTGSGDGLRVVLGVLLGALAIVTFALILVLSRKRRRGDEDVSSE